MKMTNFSYLTEAIPVKVAMAQPRAVARMTDVEYLTEVNTPHRQEAMTLLPTVIMQSIQGPLQTFYVQCHKP